MFCARNLRALSLLLGLFLFFPGSVDGAGSSLGPLFQEFTLTLDPGHRIEAAGPFYYQQEIVEDDDVTRLWAVPPILSYLRNEHTDYEQFDFLWKAITYNRYGEEYRFHILQLFNLAGGQTQSDTNVSRFTLFPLYFQQRSRIPEKNYTALLPFYGRIQGRLFRDEINFAAFPIYGQTRKRDVVTDNYLYPIFHVRHGDGLKGWQVWPLFSHERKAVTSKTNVWDEVETVGGHRKRFILWPIFMEQHTGLGTANPAQQQALLPFYTFLRSPRRDSTTWLWPLGVTHTVDQEKQYDEWGAPWPLVVFTRGEGKTINRVWPFFSQASNTNLTSDWYLWPLYKYNRLHSDPLDRERTRILLFLYSDLSVKNTETGKRLRQLDLWPLFTSRRDLEGRNRLQILALLEPFLPNNTSVERDISPLWSLWRSEKNSRTGATSQSLLWNLYRRDTAPEGRKCSLLFGLFQYQSGKDGRRWRVLYVPFGKSRPSEKPSAP
jgi:hypothetical protein